MRRGFYELKRKVQIGIFAAVAGALLLLAPWVGRVLAEPVRVGVFPNLHCALIYLADSQGYFKKHGIDVVITAQESGLVAINELIADKIDIAPTAEFAFVLQAFKHPDLRIAATIYDGSDHDLIVRKDRAIARPQDLKGKRVAVTQNSSGEFFLYNYLIFNRIPAASIHVAYLTPHEIVKAMAGGSVDAALSWPPYTTQMVKQLGAKVAVWPAQSGQEWYVVLLAKEGFLKTQPKTMDQFLAALSDAEGFLTKYPDRAQAVLRNILKMDAETFLHDWSGSRFQLLLTQDLLVLMEREAKWAMRSDLVEKGEMPNYLDFLSFGALDKVKPEAVSIVH